ncbi:Hypothetical protein SCLAV_p0314 (plasmid) [Streptomyces clavuligerus]|uniref:Uncharacterized protein n=1 Tax=Streptomyces clavuligerus TaxID=1901 RepID=B5GS11_STRCL|nr:hypothetical protein SSCG_02135 [Streptomyces clavuligerus]EFG03805.1 Hypothetical protein SCLAV_p0314 [Streptomyces clavuligerus]
MPTSSALPWHGITLSHDTTANTALLTALTVLKA